MNAVLTVEGIFKRYGGRVVLSSASFRAVQGELRVLVGRNGSGKSTLLRIAAGIVSADEGSVRYDGLPVRPTLSTLAVNGLFFLPDRDLLSSAWSVRAQLDWFQRRFNGRDPGEVAALLQIEDCLTRSPDQLSGGERRRAEIAAIMVRQPRCVLADEPLRGLPPLEIDRLLEVFLALAKEGAAVVLTGHDVPAIFSVAHHVTWCRDGTTSELGPPTRLHEHEQFSREYLGPTLANRMSR